MSGNVERTLRSLSKYNKRMRGRTKRPRGNPKNLVEMLSPLLNGHRCFVCRKSHNEMDLHHVNGIWNDYSIENLIFVCRPCHLYALHQGSWKNHPIKLSEEVVMQNFQDIQKIQTVEKTRRINGVMRTTACAPEGTWTNKAGEVSTHGLQLFNYVTQLTGQGYSIIEACRELSPYYGVSPEALCTAYGVVRARETKINNMSGVSVVKNSTNKKMVGRVQMTLTDILKCIEFADAHNVDIIR